MREISADFFFHLHDWMNREINNPFIYGGCGNNSELASRNGSNNIADLLPADPFEMEMSTHLSTMDWDTTISAAIVRLFGASPGDYQVDGGDMITGLSYYRNETLLPSSFTWMNLGSGVNNIFPQGFSSSSCGVDRGRSFGSPGPVKDVSVFHKGDTVVAGKGGNNLHDGLLFSLGYLGVQDLLSVERVCRSLRSAVRNDNLLWRCIHINSPLSERITDNDIYQLTQRAQGSLQCLSLVGCSKITDDGLKRVLETNPSLRKLSVPGCLSLSVEGLIDNLKSIKLPGMPGIMTLKLGRLFMVSQKYFEELKLLVDGDELHQSKSHTLQFYHKSSSSTACEDEYGMDIELCPVCQTYKLVFDCPSEDCRSKGPEHCRACDACIARCFQCGKCVNNCKYTETFCLKYICSGCWKPPFQG